MNQRRDERGVGMNRETAFVIPEKPGRIGLPH